MLLQEHSFHTGQVRLNYIKGPDNGPPLVLLHGLTEQWLDFLPIMPHLLLRHTVYAVDLRGHGKSGRVPGCYSCSDYGQDIRAFLEGRLAGPAILFGFSTGGLVATYLGARYQELVSALILEEPALWDTTHIPWVVDYFTRCRELTSLGKTAAELREILPLESAWDRKWAARLSQLDSGPLVAWFERSHWEGFDAETMLQNISCPVLLIYGNPGRRSVLTPEQVEFIRASIPDCVSNYLDAGHALHMTQPMQTATIVTQFLDSLPGS